MIEVSIVIVCMNNLKNLYPCLDSIRKYTSVSYETIVVAYLFSKENLEKARRDYPWATFIESNEIRGFSENNNLALKQARGRYCFVLNDDTILPMPVIDNLCTAMEKQKDAAIMSPATYFMDGRVQSCGRPKHTLATYLLSALNLWKEQKIKSRYTYKSGIFQTYNVVGAAFLIRTDVFKELGWFDERYFFCPEDIALSTLANMRGYKAYVDPSVWLYHVENGTATFVRTATEPAAVIGSIIFYSNGSRLKKMLLEAFNITILSIKYFAFSCKYLLSNKRDVTTRIKMLSKRNSLAAIFSGLAPKEAFIKFYTKIRK